MRLSVLVHNPSSIECIIRVSGDSRKYISGRVLTDKEKLECSEYNPILCHFFQSKSHMDFPATDPRPRRGAAGYSTAWDMKWP